MDLDLGLQISLLDDGRYQEIAQRLRGAGFTNDHTVQGNPTRQRWVHTNGLTVDFLIPPSDPKAVPGGLQNLESDFAAVITPGLETAFLDSVEMQLSGTLPSGDHVSRPIWICGPGAFVILKSLAFRNRAEPKDAYDLHFMLNNWEDGIDDIVQRVYTFSDHPLVVKAIGHLKEDFAAIDSIGPGSIDRFSGGDASNDVEFRADASARVLEFCRRVEKCLESQ